MELTAAEIDAIRRYLLGRLPPERWTPLEERLLTDGDFRDELSIAEEELIDRYLSGGLDAEDRAGFETHFLRAPERQKKLRFARALRRFVAAEAASAPHVAANTTTAPSADLHLTDSAEAVEQETHGAGDAPRPAPDKPNFFKLLFGRRPALAFSLAAALLLVAAVSWVSLRPTSSFEPRNPYAVALTPGLVRGGGAGELTRVTIPADADALRLRLELTDEGHETYSAELQDAERRTVHAAGPLRAEVVDGRRVVVVDAPTKDLTPGDYQLRLGGNVAGRDPETVGRYTFRILNRQ